MKRSGKRKGQALSARIGVVQVGEERDERGYRLLGVRVRSVELCCAQELASIMTAVASTDRQSTHHRAPEGVVVADLTAADVDLLL